MTAVGTVVAGCGGEVVAPPDAPAVRTLLVHRQNTDQNILLRTDGTPAGSLAVGGGILPIGIASANGPIVALHRGSSGAVVLISRDEPLRIDTILDPSPSSMSLASFSQDARFVALVSYAPVEGVLIYDRANRSVDTMPFGDAEPVLPPLFSPDNRRVGVIGSTGLSLSFTTLFPEDGSRITTEQLGFSIFTSVPIFGWPRWTEDGVLIAVVREADDAPDTVVASAFNPDRPGDFLEERFRAVLAPVSDARPELAFTSSSTYAFAADGRAMVLGANPANGLSRHAVFLVTPDVGRVQLVLDDPAQVLVFPLFVD